MSRAHPVVFIQRIDEIVRSLSNADLTARLVWVDPADSRDNIIRCTISDATRSIRLTLWGFDLEVKKFLSDNMMKIFCWSGLTARLNKGDVFLQREHLFGLSLNQSDAKFQLGFVGRFQIVEGCTLPFLDIIVPRPELMSQTPLPSPSRSQDMLIPDTTTQTVVPKRDRVDEAPAWICPVNGCRLPDYQYCMMTGNLHPAVCELCGTQGKFKFCPASPRGVKTVHADMIATTKESTPTQQGTLTFGLSGDLLDSIARHAAVVKELLGSIDPTVNVIKENTDDNKIVDKVTAENNTADKAVADKTPDKATADKPEANKVIAEKTEVDKAMVDKATADKATVKNAPTDTNSTTMNKEVPNTNAPPPPKIKQ